VTKVDTLSFLIASSSHALGGSSSNAGRGIDHARVHLRGECGEVTTPASLSRFGTSLTPSQQEGQAVTPAKCRQQRREACHLYLPQDLRPQ